MAETSAPDVVRPRSEDLPSRETFFVTCPKGQLGGVFHLSFASTAQLPRQFDLTVSFVPFVTLPYLPVNAGLGKVLAVEIESAEIGGSVTKVFASGVEFSASSMRAGYAACLWLRTGIRVLHLLSRTPDIAGEDAGGNDFDALYSFVRSAADWPTLLGGADTRTFSIQVREPPMKEGGRDDFSRDVGRRGGRRSPAQGPMRETFGTQRAQLCAKNAICDVLRDSGVGLPGRPQSHGDADVPLFLALKDGEASFYRDMAGASLHKRGYRSDSVMHRSSLNEAVAAGMLMLAGFKPSGSFKSGRREALAAKRRRHVGADDDAVGSEGGSKPRRLVLVDPMCGSGTLLIEAALFRLRVAPGLYRKEFPFERWNDFDGVSYRKLVEEAVALQRTDDDINIEMIGNDSNPAALDLARKDLERTQLSHLVRLVHGPADQLKLENDATLVVCNPPWGLRLDDEDVAWEQLGGFLRDSAPGGSAILLSGDADLTSRLRMRAREKTPIRIGNIDCRAIIYDVLERSPPAGGGTQVPQGRDFNRPRPELKRRQPPPSEWEKPEL